MSQSNASLLSTEPLTRQQKEEALINAIEKKYPNICSATSVEIMLLLRGKYIEIYLACINTLLVTLIKFPKAAKYFKNQMEVKNYDEYLLSIQSFFSTLSRNTQLDAYIDYCVLDMDPLLLSDSYLDDTLNEYN